VLAGAERKDRLWSVQENRRRDVHCIRQGLRQSVLDIIPGGYAVGLGFPGIPGHNSYELTLGFGKDRGKHTLGRDVANTDDQPIEHDSQLSDGDRKGAQPWMSVR
jgi:hypothetical protein